MKKIDYFELPEFTREFKQLKKRFKTLVDDFEIAKKAALELFHARGVNNLSTFEIPGPKGKFPIFKLKKFACKSLKGRGVKSGIRVIYAWDAVNSIIYFIEIYFKGDKEMEDMSRVRGFLKSPPTSSDSPNQA